MQASRRAASSAENQQDDADDDSHENLGRPARVERQPPKASAMRRQRQSARLWLRAERRVAPAQREVIRRRVHVHAWSRGGAHLTKEDHSRFLRALQQWPGD